MPVKRLKELLNAHAVRYTVMSHPSAYTAQEIAQATLIPGKALAKTVMVKIDGRLSMGVLPAAYRIDLAALKEAVGAATVELASESEFAEIFPDCETGAMPPFGNLYGLPVLVAQSLTENQEIAFNAGTHTEVIKMDFADFARLVKPSVLKFSVRV